MTAAALLLAAAASASAAWTVEGATSAVVASEVAAVWRGGPAGIKADLAGSGTTDFAVVSAVEKDGAWAWTILPLSTGTLTFTPRYEGASAPSLTIAVSDAALAPETEPADIKPPAKARPALWPWLLAAALAAAAWKARERWRARARPGGPAEPTAPPLPPETEAARAIAALRASGLWERDQSSYYLRLTGVLRAYLEARYREPVTAMTSAEAARLLRDRSDDNKLAAAARELLERADLVKFARVRPGADEGHRDADAVLALVDATTPKPVPAAEKAA
ncbi:MAG: hypothetical protein M0D55_13550 [Elusimicrobiota bacterium]|nr:MAG: hypothetical protein M0D55_13550 [Elusimicrobiota bacterium]